jgi:hypothetical protein
MNCTPHADASDPMGCRRTALTGTCSWMARLSASAAVTSPPLESVGEEDHRSGRDITGLPFLPPGSRRGAATLSAVTIPSPSAVLRPGSASRAPSERARGYGSRARRPPLGGEVDDPDAVLRRQVLYELGAATLIASILLGQRRSPASSGRCRSRARRGVLTLDVDERARPRRDEQHRQADSSGAIVRGAAPGLRRPRSGAGRDS